MDHKDGAARHKIEGIEVSLIISTNLALLGQSRNILVSKILLWQDFRFEE